MRGNLRDHLIYLPHFTDEETMAQRGEMISQRHKASTWPNGGRKLELSPPGLGPLSCKATSFLHHSLRFLLVQEL